MVRKDTGYRLANGFLVGLFYVLGLYGLFPAIPISAGKGVRTRKVEQCVE